MKYDYFARKEEYGWLLFNTKDSTISRANTEYIMQLSELKNIRKTENILIKNSLSSPIKVFIDITDICNLTCIHCHSDSKPKNKNEFSLEFLYNIIDQCYDMGVFVIKLSGGELLLYNQINEVIRYIYEKGMAVSMITNGTIISNDIIDMIQKYNVDIGISLDGIESTHNKIRGKGVYKKVLKSIQKLLDNNIIPKIHFTLMPDNKEDIKEMIELAKKLNITLKVSRVKPLNRAVTNKLVISNDKKFYLELINLLNKNPYCEVEDIMKVNNNGNSNILIHPLDCGAGTRILSIRSNGDILPCAFLGESFIAGNVYKDKLKDIWKNSEQFLKIRKIRFSSKCLECSYKEICHGGCLAMSQFFTSQLSGGDPDCRKSLEKEYSF